MHQINDFFSISNVMYSYYKFLIKYKCMVDLYENSSQVIWQAPAYEEKFSSQTSCDISCLLHKLSAIFIVCLILNICYGSAEDFFEKFVNMGDFYGES